MKRDEGLKVGGTAISFFQRESSEEECTSLARASDSIWNQYEFGKAEKLTEKGEAVSRHPSNLHLHHDTDYHTHQKSERRRKGS